MHDVLIVGAGTAGCVLAERLSQSGQLKVLLLEADGKPSSPFVRIPAGFTRLFRSKLDWALESEPQAAAGRRIFIPRGRMLGGSSNMNAQIHQWCHPADFDRWARAGATGWSWAEVAPVFRAMECWTGEADPARGRDGPMPIAPNRNAHPMAAAFVAAARAAGLPARPHYNGQDYEGTWMCDLAHADGRRFSVYDAYLKPAMRRPNLEVLTGAQVLRIDFANGRAAGVTARRGDSEQRFAARGVVLAAGSLMSPQLLQLSGIGPAQELQRLGIAPRIDSPEVGANLQDHPIAPLVFRTRRPDSMKSAESPLALLRYLLFRRGMLASNGIEAFAFARVRAGSGEPPDLELIFVPLEWRNQALEPPRQHAFTIGTAIVAPRSRGQVRLASGDPLAPPKVDFGLLSDADGVDATVLLAGARLARRIAATAPLAGDAAGELFPGQGVERDDELLAKLTTQIQTVYHPTSTCRMGSDARAVVDPRLHVNGAAGLWVADASVMPSVPSGHPNAVVAMLAHRATDWIAAELS